MRRLFLLLVIALLPFASWSQETTCPSRLFVSGYFSTVHVFDACTGTYLRNLDTRSRLNGAQAMRMGRDGLLYVVAETGRAIHKYRPDTLEYVGLFANTPPMGPLSMVSVKSLSLPVSAATAATASGKPMPRFTMSPF